MHASGGTHGNGHPAWQRTVVGCMCVHLAWDVAVASDVADGCRCNIAGQRSPFVIQLAANKWQGRVEICGGGQRQIGAGAGKNKGGTRKGAGEGCERDASGKRSGDKLGETERSVEQIERRVTEICW
jgi:hypothetical protein